MLYSWRKRESTVNSPWEANIGPSQGTWSHESCVTPANDT